MMIEDSVARDIAQRWGKAAGSEPLLMFASTGLIADRKKLADAVKGIRTFVKHPEELDSLLAYLKRTCPYEAAARAQGWRVEDDKVRHIHDYDQAVTYPNWRACCDGEDIPVPA